MKTFAILMLAAGAAAMGVKESKITFTADQLALLKKVGQAEESSEMTPARQLQDKTEEMKPKDYKNYEKYGEYEKFGKFGKFSRFQKYKQFAWRGKFAKYAQYEDRKCFGFEAHTCADLCTVCIDSTDPDCAPCSVCEKYIECLPQEELCKCRPPSARVVLSSEHKDLSNILSYGASCRAHDLNPGTPWFEFCPKGSPWCKESHNWCVEQWCYVNEHCDTGVPTSVFAPANLFYSYETCGNPDCYNEYAADAGCPYSDPAKRCDACECTGPVPQAVIEEADKAEDLAKLETITTYGSECAAWDNMDGTPWKDAYCPDGSPFCSRTHNWCTLPWCYVEKSCSTGAKTGVFAPANYYYSYDTCGSPDCYNEAITLDGCPVQGEFCTADTLDSCKNIDSVIEFLFVPGAKCTDEGVSGYCGMPGAEIIDFACPSACKMCGVYNYNIDNNEFLAMAFNIQDGCVSVVDENPNVCRENAIMPAVCPETCRSAK